MSRKSIYLDVCALSRPFDDQGYLRTKQEEGLERTLEYFDKLVTIQIPLFSFKPANTSNNTLIQLFWNNLSEK